MWYRGYDDYLTLEIYFFGAVKLVNNVDIDKCKYSGDGIRFDIRWTFSYPTGGGFDKNVIIFGVDMTSSVHDDNKKKDLSIFGEGPTQRLDYKALTAEKKYSLNFTETRKKFCLSLHFIEAKICLFLSGTEISINPSSLGNISKDFLKLIWKRLQFMSMFLTWLVLII